MGQPECNSEPEPDVPRESGDAAIVPDFDKEDFPLFGEEQTAGLKKRGGEGEGEGKAPYDERSASQNTVRSREEEKEEKEEEEKGANQATYELRGEFSIPKTLQQTGSESELSNHTTTTSNTKKNQPCKKSSSNQLPNPWSSGYFSSKSTSPLRQNTRANRKNNSIVNECCALLINPHLLTLQLTCPVIYSAANMISMSCKSQAEVFARSLQTKLKVLDAKFVGINNNNSSDSDEDGTSSEDGGRHHSTHYLPAPGTTFPPVRCVHFDQLRAKYHSESDLTPGNLALIKRSVEDDFQDLFDPIDKDVEDGDGMEKDSDLFFDFDIGSPEEGETSGIERKESLANLENGVIDYESCDFGQKSGSEMIASSCSPSNFHSPDNLASSSRFFGSVSSGLCSDLDTLQSRQEPNDEIEDEDGQCMSIAPQDWPLKLHLGPSNEVVSLSSTTSTPIATSQSPANVASPIVSPDSLLDETEEPAAIELTIEESGKPLPDLETLEKNIDSNDFQVYTGNAVHTVANSKLNALIALLEPERDYSSSRSSRSSSLRSSKEGSPQKSVSSSRRTNSESEKPASGYKCPLPTIAASPANFSFLTANPIKESSDGVDEESANLIRCDSTPVLTTTERDFIDSPKVQRKELGKAREPSEEKTLEVAAPKEALSVEKPQVRRATSLKSGKTPPGTPGRRKIVRFADVFGLDLADVKHFLDEIPRVPKSAYHDLKDAELSDIESEASNSDTGFSVRTAKGFHLAPSSRILVSAQSNKPSTSLVPMFNQPGGFANFFDLIHSKKVCLENAYMADKCSIKGTVRVQNISFHKKVVIRYTTNEWIRSFDLDAKYLDGSCDGFSDKFNFYLSMGSPLAVGQRIQFCIKYETENGEHWDNNDGKNYVFQCLSLAPGSSGAAAGAAKEAPKSAPLNMSAPRSQPIYNTSSYSQSPSAMSEDPWFKYL